MKIQNILQKLASENHQERHIFHTFSYKSSLNFFQLLDSFSGSQRFVSTLDEFLESVDLFAVAAHLLITEKSKFDVSALLHLSSHALPFVGRLMALNRDPNQTLFQLANLYHAAVVGALNTSLALGNTLESNNITAQASSYKQLPLSHFSSLSSSPVQIRDLIMHILQTCPSSTSSKASPLASPSVALWIHFVNLLQEACLAWFARCFNVIMHHQSIAATIVCADPVYSPRFRPWEDSATDRFLVKQVLSIFSDFAVVPSELSVLTQVLPEILYLHLASLISETCSFNFRSCLNSLVLFAANYSDPSRLLSAVSCLIRERILSADFLSRTTPTSGRLRRVSFPIMKSVLAFWSENMSQLSAKEALSVKATVLQFMDLLWLMVLETSHVYVSPLTATAVDPDASQHRGDIPQFAAHLYHSSNNVAHLPSGFKSLFATTSAHLESIQDVRLAQVSNLFLDGCDVIQRIISFSGNSEDVCGWTFRAWFDVYSLLNGPREKFQAKDPIASGFPSVRLREFEALPALQSLFFSTRSTWSPFVHGLSSSNLRERAPSTGTSASAATSTHGSQTLSWLKFRKTIPKKEEPKMASIVQEVITQHDLDLTVRLFEVDTVMHIQSGLTSQVLISFLFERVEALVSTLLGQVGTSFRSVRHGPDASAYPNFYSSRYAMAFSDLRNSSQISLTLRDRCGVDSWTAQPAYGERPTHRSDTSSTASKQHSFSEVDISSDKKKAVRHSLSLNMDRDEPASLVDHGANLSPLESPHSRGRSASSPLESTNQLAFAKETNFELNCNAQDATFVVNLAPLRPAAYSHQIETYFDVLSNEAISFDAEGSSMSPTAAASEIKTEDKHVLPRLLLSQLCLIAIENQPKLTIVARADVDKMDDSLAFLDSLPSYPCVSATFFDLNCIDFDVVVQFKEAKPRSCFGQFLDSIGADLNYEDCIWKGGYRRFDRERRLAKLKIFKNDFGLLLLHVPQFLPGPLTRDDVMKLTCDDLVSVCWADCLDEERTTELISRLEMLYEPYRNLGIGPVVYIVVSRLTHEWGLFEIRILIPGNARTRLLFPTLSFMEFGPLQDGSLVKASCLGTMLRKTVASVHNTCLRRLIYQRSAIATSRRKESSSSASELDEPSQLRPPTHYPYSFVPHHNLKQLSPLAIRKRFLEDLRSQAATPHQNPTLTLSQFYSKMKYY